MQPTQLDLLPTVRYAPVWPAEQTLAAEALKRLLDGERLTQISFGTNRWRLAAYIHRLKCLGWPVVSALVRHPNRARPIAQYWISKDCISTVRRC